MAEEKLYYCEKCRKAMKRENFYASKNTEKYPDGIVHECKQCMTMHVDNWDEKTYLPILKELDVPYLPEKWNQLLSKYGKNRAKVTGMTIIGRYLSQMHMKQYEDYRWEDTAFLQEVENKKISDTMKRQGYSASEIAETLDKGITTPPAPPVEEEEDDDFATGYMSVGPARSMSAEELGLTDEDVQYLRMKWGKGYNPEEWVFLERHYEDMMNSYEIHQAGHRNDLILVCKSYLKVNQLMDIGDVEGAQKMSKVYNDLMKSGKFTAVQNKTEVGEYVDSISELVLLCEQQGFIPRYYVDTPNDKVDKVIMDLQGYTRSLITEETNLGEMIESAMTQIQKDTENEAKTNEHDLDDDDDLFADLDPAELTDEDFEEQNKVEEAAADADLALIESELE